MGNPPNGGNPSVAGGFHYSNRRRKKKRSRNKRAIDANEAPRQLSDEEFAQPVVGREGSNSARHSAASGKSKLARPLPSGLNSPGGTARSAKSKNQNTAHALINPTRQPTAMALMRRLKSGVARILAEPNPTKDLAGGPAARVKKLFFRRNETGKTEE